MRLCADTTRRLFVSGEIEITATPEHLVLDIEGRHFGDTGHGCVRIRLSQLGARALRDQLDDALTYASISDSRQTQIRFHVPDSTLRNA